MNEDVLLALTRDGAVPVDFPALEQRALGETFRLLDGAKLEAGKPARRLMDQLLTGIVQRDAGLFDIYVVSPEDAVRMAFGRLLRFVGLEKAVPKTPEEEAGYAGTT